MRPSPGTRFLERDEGRRLTRASICLLIAAALFVLSGAVEVLGIVSDKRQVEEARRVIAASDHAREVASRPWSRGMPPPEELHNVPTREGVAKAKAIVAELGSSPSVEWTVAVSLGLAGFMVVLFLWSRRSPLPAMMTALAAYLALFILQVVLDPDSVLHGVVWKLAFVITLISGIAAALDRGAREEAGPNPPEPSPTPIGA
jgi:hypothetical protein